MLSILRELRNLHKELKDPNVPLEIMISDEVRASIKTMNKINEGTKSSKLQFKMKLKALVKGKDSHKVNHLITRYATSAPIHNEIRFYKEFKAPADHDFEIEVEHYASNKFI